MNYFLTIYGYSVLSRETFHTTEFNVISIYVLKVVLVGHFPWMLKNFNLIQALNQVVRKIFKTVN